MHRERTLCKQKSPRKLLHIFRPWQEALLASGVALVLLGAPTTAQSALTQDQQVQRSALEQELRKIRKKKTAAEQNHQDALEQEKTARALHDRISEQIHKKRSKLREIKEKIQKTRDVIDNRPTSLKSKWNKYLQAQNAERRSKALYHRIQAEISQKRADMEKSKKEYFSSRSSGSSTLDIRTKERVYEEAKTEYQETFEDLGTSLQAYQEALRNRAQASTEYGRFENGYSNVRDGDNEQLQQFLAQKHEKEKIIEEYTRKLNEVYRKNSLSLQGPLSDASAATGKSKEVLDLIALREVRTLRKLQELASALHKNARTVTLDTGSVSGKVRVQTNPWSSSSFEWPKYRQPGSKGYHLTLAELPGEFFASAGRPFQRKPRSVHAQHLDAVYRHGLRDIEKGQDKLITYEDQHAIVEHGRSYAIVNGKITLMKSPIGNFAPGHTVVEHHDRFYMLLSYGHYFFATKEALAGIYQGMLRYGGVGFKEGDFALIRRRGSGYTIGSVAPESTGVELKSESYYRITKGTDPGAPEEWTEVSQYPSDGAPDVPGEVVYVAQLFSPQSSDIQGEVLQVVHSGVESGTYDPTPNQKVGGEARMRVLPLSSLHLSVDSGASEYNIEDFRVTDETQEEIPSASLVLKRYGGAMESVFAAGDSFLEAVGAQSAYAHPGGKPLYGKGVTVGVIELGFDFRGYGDEFAQRLHPKSGNVESLEACPDTSARRQDVNGNAEVPLCGQMSEGAYQVRNLGDPRNPLRNWNGMLSASVLAAAMNNRGIMGIAPLSDVLALGVQPNGRGLAAAYAATLGYARDIHRRKTRKNQTDTSPRIISLGFPARTPGEQSGTFELRSIPNYATAFKTAHPSRNSLYWYEGLHEDISGKLPLPDKNAQKNMRRGLSQLPSSKMDIRSHATGGLQLSNQIWRAVQEGMLLFSGTGDIPARRQPTDTPAILAHQMFSSLDKCTFLPSDTGTLESEGTVCRPWGVNQARDPQDADKETKGLLVAVGQIQTQDAMNFLLTGDTTWQERQAWIDHPDSPADAAMLKVPVLGNWCGFTKKYCLVVPGGDIWAPTPTGGGRILQKYRNNSAYAAPIAAGAAALLMERWPNLTARAIGNSLLESARRLEDTNEDQVIDQRDGPSDIYGMGLLNVHHALQPIGPLQLITSSGTVLELDPQEPTPKGLPDEYRDLIQDMVAFDRYGRSFAVDPEAESQRPDARKPENIAGQASATQTPSTKGLVGRRKSKSSSARIPEVSALQPHMHQPASLSLVEHVRSQAYADHLSEIPLGWEDWKMYRVDTGIASSHPALLIRFAPASMPGMHLWAANNTNASHFRNQSRDTSGLESEFFATTASAGRPDLHLLEGKGFGSGITLPLARNLGIQATFFSVQENQGSSVSGYDRTGAIFSQNAQGRYIVGAGQSTAMPKELFTTSLVWRPSPQGSMTVSLARLHERKSLLGNAGSGLFRLGNARSSIGSATLEHGLGEKWRVQLGYAQMHSSASNPQGILTKWENMHGNSYSVGLIRKGVLDVDDRLGFSVSQPLRVRSGQLTAKTPVGLVQGGTPVSGIGDHWLPGLGVQHDARSVALRPQGRTQTYELQYTRFILSNVVLKSWGLYQQQPGHNASIKNVWGVGFQIERSF